MTEAKYLLRFDDICPTMKWTVWNQVEQILDEYDIKPIIAVIPDNTDPSLVIEPSPEDYWDTIKRWQEKGWQVALHGYQHKYENTNSGILRINDYSEFAGIDRSIQYDRLNNGLNILKKNRIECDMWIAPAHSFDKNTIDCLKMLGVEYISDGYSDTIFEHYNMKWIPCQLYKFEEKPSGVWTVCKHPSMWSTDDLDLFKDEIKKWHNRIVDVKIIKEMDFSTIDSNRQWKLSQRRCNKIWIDRKVKDIIQRRLPMLKKPLIFAIKILRGGGNKMSA